MDVDRWRPLQRSSPLLQELWEYAQHEHRTANTSIPSSLSLTSSPQASRPLYTDSLLSGDQDVATSHRSFDPSLPSDSASSSPTSTSYNNQPMHQQSPTRQPLVSSRVHPSPSIRPLSPSPLPAFFPTSPSAHHLGALPSPASRASAMWHTLNTAHQRQVDDLLHRSAVSSSTAASDAVLSQLHLLEMGRAMRVRRIIRQHVQWMQSEAHMRLTRRCWYAWMQCVWQRAEGMRIADEWKHERQQPKLNDLGRQSVRRWRAAVNDRHQSELLRELSAMWLSRRCLHAWHSLLYVHHARLHLALMHRHTLYRERVRAVFDAWLTTARGRRREKQKERGVERLRHRRVQARLRSILRRWSGYVSMERQCRTAVQAAMVSGYQQVRAVRPLLLNRDAIDVRELG